MTLKQAMKRIEELERRVKKLEANPVRHEYHYHYHVPAVTPVTTPDWTQPTTPIFQPVWCGTTSNYAHSADVPSTKTMC